MSSLYPFIPCSCSFVGFHLALIALVWRYGCHNPLYHSQKKELKIMATYTKNKPANKVTTTFKDIYQEVTDAVIQALEEGTVIWQCPWNSAGLPKNITTGIQYRGWNLLWLNFHSSLKGYTAPYYITYKQAQNLGGSIKRGQSGTKIIYWATIELKDNAADSN
jgi:antirestriction protein ArdC